MQVLAGTSGFSYKEWLGHFYPEKLPGDAMLRYYAERFATVEINNTFYRMPAESMLSNWANEVPAHFTFTLKAPRRITHEKRLREAGPDTAELVRRAQALGGKLGDDPMRPVIDEAPDLARALSRLAEKLQPAAK